MFDFALSAGAGVATGYGVAKATKGNRRLAMAAGGTTGGVVGAVAGPCLGTAAGAGAGIAGGYIDHPL